MPYINIPARSTLNEDGTYSVCFYAHTFIHPCIRSVVQHSLALKVRCSTDSDTFSGLVLVQMPTIIEHSTFSHTSHLAGAQLQQSGLGFSLSALFLAHSFTKLVVSPRALPSPSSLTKLVFSPRALPSASSQDQQCHWAACHHN